MVLECLNMWNCLIDIDCPKTVPVLHYSDC